MERASLCAYVAPFLDHLRITKGVSDNTRKSYYSDLIGLFTFWEEREKTADKKVLFHEAIKRFRAALLAQKISASSIARKISCYNSFAHFLTQQGVLDRVSFVRPHVILPALKTITPSEITFLLEKVDGKKLSTPMPHRDRCILELLYATGVRCSELSTIRIADINFTEKSITVRNNKSSLRTVYFGDRALAQLNGYLTTERPTIEQATEYLFLNYRREPLTPRSIQRICGMFGAFLGRGRELTPQILRHSFAVHSLEKGMPLATVQHLLGHTVRISTERYIK